MNYSFTNKISNMYKEDLALNNLEGLICHKTPPTNQSNTMKMFILSLFPSVL